MSQQFGFGCVKYEPSYEGTTWLDNFIDEETLRISREHLTFFKAITQDESNMVDEMLNPIRPVARFAKNQFPRVSFAFYVDEEDHDPTEILACLSSVRAILTEYRVVTSNLSKQLEILSTLEKVCNTAISFNLAVRAAYA